MSFYRALNAFNPGTGAVGGTQDLTTTDPDLGQFQPVCGILFHGGQTGTIDAVSGKSLLTGIGFLVSPTSRACVGIGVGRGLDTTDTCRQGRTDACMVGLNSSSLNGLLDVSSVLSNGWRLIVDDQWSTDIRGHVLSFGGTDFTIVQLIEITQPVATGNQDYTVTGFTADAENQAVLIISAAATDEVLAAEARIMLGVAAGGGATPVNAVLGGRSADAAASSSTGGYCRAGECIGIVSSSTAVAIRGQVTAWLANGFRINWTEVDTTQRKFYALCLKGPQFFLGDLLTQLDTTTDIVETYAFPPKAVLHFSGCKAASTVDVATQDLEWSVGAAVSPTSRAAHGVADPHGFGFSQPSAAVEHDELYINLNQADGIEGLMDSKTFDATGHTNIMDDADPTPQRFVPFLAVGAAPTTATVIPTVLGMGIGVAAGGGSSWAL